MHARSESGHLKMHKGIMGASVTNEGYRTVWKLKPKIL